MWFARAGDNAVLYKSKDDGDNWDFVHDWSSVGAEIASKCVDGNIYPTSILKPHLGSSSYLTIIAFALL